MESENNQQTFIHHLVELRTCIIRSAWIIIIGFSICVYFSDKIFDVIRAPILPYLGTAGGLVFTAPIDKFTSYLKVSFMAGAIITCPLWLYQVWIFVAPGLYKKEKKMAAYFIFFGSSLFVVGVLFVYKIVYPMAFKYLLTFGGTVDKPMITITEYLSFFITTTLIFGLAFEMPLILAVLAVMGVIDDKLLTSKRRIAYMIIAVLAAVITPPDAISMLSMLGPMILLYEVSILIVRQIAKGQAEKNKI
jgi:sec-independent protein translocase protein TatC